MTDRLNFQRGQGGSAWRRSTAPEPLARRQVEKVSLLKALTALKHLLVGADPPRPGGRLLTVWILAAAGAIYLAHGGAHYLDLKSGLPYALCLIGGVALAGPLVLLVTRPLLAWRAAWLSAVVTGVAVQSHHRTPFSWHPAILALQMLILCVIAVRLPLAVTAWAALSMALLVRLSFYPADWLPIMEIVAAMMGVAALIGALRRFRRTRLIDVAEELDAAPSVT